MFAAMFAGFVFGLAAAVAPCVIIWGPGILSTALGSTPDKSHPAFWVGLLLLVPCVSLGLAAGFMLLFLPVAFRHPAIFEAIKFDSRDSVLATPMRWYARHLLEYANRLEQQAKNNLGKI
jgi:hypothetical protein